MASSLSSDDEFVDQHFIEKQLAKKRRRNRIPSSSSSSELSSVNSYDFGVYVSDTDSSEWSGATSNVGVNNKKMTKKKKRWANDNDAEDKPNEEEFFRKYNRASSPSGKKVQDKPNGGSQTEPAGEPSGEPAKEPAKEPEQEQNGNEPPLEVEQNDDETGNLYYNENDYLFEHLPTNE